MQQKCMTFDFASASNNEQLTIQVVFQAHTGRDEWHAKRGCAVRNKTVCVTAPQNAAATYYDTNYILLDSACAR